MTSTQPSALSADVQAYLQRIGYSGSISLDLATLTKLQEQHLFHVPYENFDILQGVALSLDIPDLYDKIVVRNRGGYCFELNGLFGWLLAELGFSVTHYSARFWRGSAIEVPKRRHRILIVEVAEGRYLCDVGVGGAVFLQPLPLIENSPVEQRSSHFLFKQDPLYGWMLYEQKSQESELIYSFKEEPQIANDFITTSFWCELAADSPFNKTPIVCIQTPDGRKTLDNREFRIFGPSGVETFTPDTEEAFAATLRERFGIVF